MVATAARRCCRYFSAVSHDPTSFNLLEVNALPLRMIFPPELVDEILAHLRHNRKTLRHCSLVAKSWAYSCQKLLYTRIYITPLAYDIWRGIASPTSAELYRHVRSLTIRQTWALPDSYEDYLKSFYRLQHLTLVEVIDINLDIVNLFLPFQNTLSSLSLCYVSLTSDAFIKLLGYFPNLRVFRLTAPTFYSNPRTVPPPPTPLRGTLRLSDSFGKKGDTLLRQLCDLKLEYDELDLHRVSSCTPRIHSLVSACEKTLTRLTLSSWNSKFHALIKSRVLLNDASIQQKISPSLS